MKLQEVTNCFPNIKDWEDSYLKEGGQRIMAASSDNNYAIEIILGEEINKVAVFFDKAGAELVACLNLVTGNTSVSLSYLEGASAFVRDNPNTSYQKTFGDFQVGLSQIRGKDMQTNFLIIEPVGVPPLFPEKKDPSA